MTRFRKVSHLLILAGLLSAIANRAGAQARANPAPLHEAVVFYEAFEGSTNREGQVMTWTSSATYHFGEHFSAGVGIPVYFNRAYSTTGTTSNSGIGNVFAVVGATWSNPRLNYATTITAAAPTGDASKGISTGHGTFDWNNRLDRHFGAFTPFADAGLANSVTDTRFFLRPFTSFGDLAHLEGGTDIDLSHWCSLTLSAYDIAPWGDQTVISRVIGSGSRGSGGGHGRVFEINHESTGGPSLTHDDGFTAGVMASPKPYLDFELGYTRSVRFALNTVSFGVGINLSQVFRRGSGSVR